VQVQPYKVLVADDCVDETLVLCEGLKAYNYDVTPVYCGRDVIAKCEAGGIDLVLLDVGLPDIDGYEVCKRLKENTKTDDIPVIFVTARGETHEVTKGYALGAVDYIAKPYNLPIVMVRVDAAMRTRQVADYLDPNGDVVNDTVYTDHLTGLRNRRFLLERLQEEVEKAHRYNYPVSCIIFDVDEVMALDEDLGAASMDDLLVEIALAMRNASRTHDILARYDGALFAAILPHTKLDDAVHYASKIQNEVTSTTFSAPSFPTRAQLSFGIVTCRNGSARGAEQVLGEAMRNLFQASTLGGDHMVARDLSQDP
jgi:diguanylate cyclase (GGDEF)-like protein